MGDVKRQGVEIHKMHFDGRGTGSVKEGFFVETSDATALTVKALPLGEDKSVYVKAYALGMATDGGEAIRAETLHAFRRAASGDVTAVGSATSVTANDFTGTPTLTIVANTGDQTVDVKVTGIASNDINWEVYICYMQVSA